ncbi:pectate lyase family protein [Zhihengliuella flava]|uniref:Pectate lyase n=1 Tax=Zhihengliuella flava TaxID=1285193 RepID=A0A931GEK6_9MICC|nr:pectate lyase [Zhihengliuella flava]
MLSSSGTFTALLGAAATLAVTAAGLPVGASAAPANPAERGHVFSASDQAPGWASENGGTTGGAVATPESTYVVTNRAELLAALDNAGQRHEPKMIYISGTIHGNEADDGRLLGEQEYAPGYDVEKYLSCFGAEGWSDQLHEYCGDQRRTRQSGSNAMKRQSELSIPSNTTLVGLGDDAGIDQATVMLHLAHNVVIRNLTLEAPVDYFSSWDPYDGEEGSWNARFDAVSSVTSTNIWLDHVTLTDGDFLDRDAPMGPNGKPMNRHDGLFDMKDGSDYITVSNSRFENHDKTMLLGSGDDNADTDEGRLRISLIGNFFDGIKQRAPRVRFGQVHVLNNYFLGHVKDPQSPVTSGAVGGHDYFMGLGYKSQVYSERNSFDYRGPGADETVAVHVWNANHFLDEGSWFNQRPVDLNALASEQFGARVEEAAASGEPLPEWAAQGFTSGIEWDPPYEYEPLTTPSEVKRHARTSTGAGTLTVTAP